MKSSSAARKGRNSSARKPEKAQVSGGKPLQNKQIAAKTGPRAQTNTNKSAPQALQGEVISRPKVGRLKTLAQWRKEMARVYRAMRRYEMHPEVGTKLAYVATQGAKMCKDEEELQTLRAMAEDIKAVKEGRALPHQTYSLLPAPTEEEPQV